MTYNRFLERRGNLGLWTNDVVIVIVKGVVVKISHVVVVRAIGKLACIYYT